MKETAYAYAVASVRANENNLLAKADFEALIMAEDYLSALRWLEGKGWDGIAADPERYLDEILEESWQLIYEVAPDKEVLSFLVIPSDFQNAKAALKAFFSGSEAKYISPRSVEPSLFKEALADKSKAEEIPPYLADALSKAYDALTQTFDGQLAEIMFDRAALEAVRQKGQSSGIPFIRDICDMMCAFSDIKVCYRAILTKKNRDFLDAALCGSDELPKPELTEAALSGMDNLFELVKGTRYEEAAQRLKVSLSEYERFCDDSIISFAQSAKYLSFGPQPLVAYFLARQAEIKNVRIILACKRGGMPLEAIRRRERMLYV